MNAEAVSRREFQMNAIFIHDLRVETKIGVYEWERHLPRQSESTSNSAYPRRGRSAPAISPMP